MGPKFETEHILAKFDSKPTWWVCKKGGTLRAHLWELGKGPFLVAITMYPGTKFGTWPRAVDPVRTEIQISVQHPGTCAGLIDPVRLRNIVVTPLVNYVDGECFNRKVFTGSVSDTKIRMC